MSQKLEKFTTNKDHRRISVSWDLRFWALSRSKYKTWNVKCLLNLKPVVEESRWYRVIRVGVRYRIEDAEVCTYGIIALGMSDRQMKRMRLKDFRALFLEWYRNWRSVRLIEMMNACKIAAKWQNKQRSNAARIVQWTQRGFARWGSKEREGGKRRRRREDIAGRSNRTGFLSVSVLLMWWGEKEKREDDDRLRIWEWWNLLSGIRWRRNGGGEVWWSQWRFGDSNCVHRGCWIDPSAIIRESRVGISSMTAQMVKSWCSYHSVLWLRNENLHLCNGSLAAKEMNLSKSRQETLVRQVS